MSVPYDVVNELNVKIRLLLLTVYTQLTGYVCVSVLVCIVFNVCFCTQYTCISTVLVGVLRLFAGAMLQNIVLRNGLLSFWNLKITKKSEFLRTIVVFRMIIHYL